MRLLLLSLAAFMTFVLPANAWEVKYPEAKIYAVEVWAEWCPNCKILDPQIEKAKLDGALADKNILFVRMDFTDKTTINQSKMLAKSLGLEEFLKANGAGTGYLALVDVTTKKEVARFTRDSTAQDITDGINQHLTP